MFRFFLAKMRYLSIIDTGVVSMFFYEKDSFFENRLDFLKIQINMRALARKLEKGSISVNDMAKELESLSRIERYVLKELLPHFLKEKFQWAEEELLKAREAALLNAESHQGCEEYMESLPWCDLLELFGKCGKAIDEKIFDYIELEVYDNGTINRAFMMLVDIFRGMECESKFAQGFASKFGEDEKELLLELFFDICFGEHPGGALVQLNNTLKVFLGTSDNKKFVVDLFYKLVFRVCEDRSCGKSEENYSIVEHSGKIEAIDMNPSSTDIIADSLLVDNSSSAYIISLIELFQSLPSIEESLKEYSIVSHAVTIFWLRLLKKHGVIEMGPVEYDRKCNLAAFYLTLSNKTRSRESKMYKTKIIKRRNLTSEDLEWIEAALPLVGSSKSDIEFKNSAGILHAKVSLEAAYRNIMDGSFLKKMKYSYLSDLIAAESDNLGDRRISM